MAEQTTGASLGLLATVAGGAYLVGRFSKSGSEAVLPGVGALVMTFVVFRALDSVWPTLTGAIQNTTLPGTLIGVTDSAKEKLNGFFSSGPLNLNPLRPSKQTVDSYTVK